VASMAAQLSRMYSVDVIHSGKGYTVAGLAEAFGLDLSRVNERIVPDSLGTFSLPGLSLGYVRERLELDRRLTEPYDLFIYSGHGVPPFCAARHGMVYCHFPFEWHPSLELSRTEGWAARSMLSRWVRMQGYLALWYWRMRGYRTVIGNSEFTSSWIQRRGSGRPRWSQGACRLNLAAGSTRVYAGR